MSGLEYIFLEGDFSRLGRKMGVETFGVEFQEVITNGLNRMAEDGWRLHTLVSEYVDEETYYTIVFERDK